MQRFITYLAAGVVLLGVAAYVLFARGGTSFQVEKKEHVVVTHTARSENATQPQGEETFDQLKVSGPVEVYVTIGATHSYTLEGPQELLERMEVRLERGVLEVAPRRSWNSWNYNEREKLQLNVTVKSLSSIDLSGAVKLRCDGILKADRLRLDLSGATSVELTLDATQVSMDGSGATNVALKGTTDRAEYDLSGASKVRAADLKARVVTLEASGASNVEVYANEALHVETTGASNVRYQGAPTDLVINTSGASKVRKF